MAVTEEKQGRLTAAVEQLFDQQIKAEKPDWPTFYRRILGRHGLVFRAYPSIDDRSQFEKTDLYRRIQCMITELRKKAIPDEASQKDTKVITVRIPKALHEALADEARDYSTSVNKLCISKLVQFIDAERIPSPRREQAPEELSWMDDALFSAPDGVEASGAVSKMSVSEEEKDSTADHSHETSQKAHSTHVFSRHHGRPKHEAKGKSATQLPVDGDGE